MPPESPSSVTVVIATYNQVDLLPLSVASVIDDQPDAQLVIVVDACPFGTDVVARSLAQAHPERISLVELDVNLGQAGARNVGLAHVRTPWVQFLDGDDLLEPAALERLVAHADARPKRPTVLLGRFDRVDEEGRRLDPGSAERTDDPHHVVRKGQRNPAPLSLEPFLTSWFIGPPGAWLLDAELVRSVGGFDEGLHNWVDLELMARLLPVADIDEIPMLVLHKRIHASQVSRRAGFFHVHGWRFRSWWRTLRRAAPADRKAILGGMRGNCIALADSPAVPSGVTGTTTRLGWRLAARGIVVVGLIESVVRRVAGRLAAPASRDLRQP